MAEQSRNKEWFAGVFNQYYATVRNYLYYLSGDIEWSEDRVQDVFLLVWEKRMAVREETLKQFLYTIARNFFLKDTRKRKYHLQFINGQTDNTDFESPEFKLEMKEFDQKLQEAIASLPEKCRSIFLMNRIDKMPYREIAVLLGVTEKAIEKQMSKALSLLRVRIANNL